MVIFVSFAISNLDLMKTYPFQIFAEYAKVKSNQNKNKRSYAVFLVCAEYVDLYRMNMKHMSGIGK